MNDGVHAYTYDAENKIRTVDSVTANTFDGEGRRVKKLMGENIRFVDGTIVAHGSGSSFGVTFQFLTDKESRAAVTNILKNTNTFDSGSFGLGHKKDVGATKSSGYKDYRSINGVLDKRSLEVAINPTTMRGYADTDRFSFYHGLAPASAHLFLEFFPNKLKGLFK